MRIALPLLLSLGVWTATAQADTVKLADGGSLEGQAHEIGDKVVVELPSGTITLSRQSVKELVRAPSAVQVHDARHAALQHDDVDGRVQLAHFCRDQGLTRREAKLWREVIELDANHAEAHARLDHVRHGEVWVTSSPETSAPSDISRLEAAAAVVAAELDLARTEQERAHAERNAARLKLERQREETARRDAEKAAAVRARTRVTHYIIADKPAETRRARRNECRTEACKTKRRGRTSRPNYYAGPAHSDFPIAGVKHPRRP